MPRGSLTKGKCSKNKNILQLEKQTTDAAYRHRADDLDVPGHQGSHGRQRHLLDLLDPGEHLPLDNGGTKQTEPGPGTGLRANLSPYQLPAVGPSPAHVPKTTILSSLPPMSPSACKTNPPLAEAEKKIENEERSRKSPQIGPIFTLTGNYLRGPGSGASPGTRVHPPPCAPSATPASSSSPGSSTLPGRSCSSKGALFKGTGVSPVKLTNHALYSKVFCQPAGIDSHFVGGKTTGTGEIKGRNSKGNGNSEMERKQQDQPKIIPRELQSLPST
jgi:hypothetical protein